MSILGVSVQDANGDEVPDTKVMIKNLRSQRPNGLEETLKPGGLGVATRHVFNLGSVPQFSIDLKAPAAAGSVFSQWISILPTDQIVAMKYTPAIDT